MLSQPKWLFSQILWLIPLLLLALPTLSFSLEPEMEDEVETLDLIEITGTVVEQEPRDLNFSLPNIQTQAEENLKRTVSSPATRAREAAPNTIHGAS